MVKYGYIRVVKTSLIREINVGCFSFPDDDDSKSQDKIDEGERRNTL